MLNSPKQLHTANAADVTATEIVFQFDYVNPAYALVAVYTAAGAVKAWDGAATISGNTVTVDNTGAVDFADTDVVICEVIPDTAVV